MISVKMTNKKHIPKTPPLKKVVIKKSHFHGFKNLSFTEYRTVEYIESLQTFEISHHFKIYVKCNQIRHSKSF